MVKSNMPNGARIDDMNGLSGSGRYIRMNGTARTTTWGYSIYEFEVYGTEAGTNGITENSLNKFCIYPTCIGKSEKMQVSCPSELLPADYQIYNTTGQLRKQGILTENICFLDMDASLPTGFYFFRLRHNGSSKTEKFLITN
jgi:hypothetical protein